MGWGHDHSLKIYGKMYLPFSLHTIILCVQFSIMRRRTSSKSFFYFISFSERSLIEGIFEWFLLNADKNWRIRVYLKNLGFTPKILKVQKALVFIYESLPRNLSRCLHMRKIFSWILKKASWLLLPCIYFFHYYLWFFYLSFFTSA